MSARRAPDDGIQAGGSAARAQRRVFAGLEPAHALILPLFFTLVLIALGGLPTVRHNPNLLWSFWGAAAVLLAWNAPGPRQRPATRTRPGRGRRALQAALPAGVRPT